MMHQGMILMSVLVGTASTGADEVLDRARRTTSSATNCATTNMVSTYVAGTICDMPFYYNGVLYEKATTAYNGILSCPVLTSYDKSATDGYWASATCTTSACVTAYTEHSGGSAMPSGVSCSFPFVFNGITYNNCAKHMYADDGTQDIGWCAVGADDTGEGWEWAQWGDCNCGGSNPSPATPPPPAPPPPSPSPPGPPSPSPPSPPPSPPSPSPSPGNGRQKSGKEGADSVAAGFGTVAALVIGAGLVFLIYKRQRQRRNDIGDLAPWGFEKEALIGRSPAGPNTAGGYGRPDQSFDERSGGLHLSGAPPIGSHMGSPMGGAGGGGGGPMAGGSNPMMSQQQQKYPSNAPMYNDGNMTMGSADLSSSQHSMHNMSIRSNGASGVGNTSTAGLDYTLGSVASEGVRMGGLSTDDWIQTEAAAAKMRSCFIKKSPGDRIGLRLLNFMGRNTRGVCVVGVKPDTAGAQAGIEEGDMMVEIDGRSVLNLTHEQVLDQLVNAGDAYSVIVSRG